MSTSRGRRDCGLQDGAGPPAPLPLLLGGLLVSLLAGCATSAREVATTVTALSPSGAPAKCCAWRSEDVPRVAEQAWGALQFEAFGRPEQASAAREALDLALECARLIRRKTGLSPQYRLTVSLFVVPGCSEASTVCPFSGKGSLGVVFQHVAGASVLADPANRAWQKVLCHELAHMFLLPHLDFSDRWLEEGLAEYLSREHLKAIDREGTRRLPRVVPPVALRQARIEPWPAEDRRGRRDRKDPKLAAHKAHLAALRYQAAEELVARFVATAQRLGNEDALKTLLADLVARGQPVSFSVLEGACLALSGQTLSELARYSDAEEAGLRREAVGLLSSSDGVDVAWALRILAEFGPPDDLDLGLIPSLVSAGASHDRAVRRETVSAAGELLGRWGDRRHMDGLLKPLEPSGHEGSLDALPPAFWLGYAAHDRKLAFERLLVIVGGEEFSLAWQDEADKALRRLTGTSAGWVADASPGYRARAARRWSRVVARLPGF